MASQVRSTAVLDFHEGTWGWQECQTRGQEMKHCFPRDEPQNPTVGQGWYDEETECLYLWDGCEWVCTPMD